MNCGTSSRSRHREADEEGDTKNDPRAEIAPEQYLAADSRCSVLEMKQIASGHVRITPEAMLGPWIVFVCLFVSSRWRESRRRFRSSSPTRSAGARMGGCSHDSSRILFVLQAARSAVSSTWWEETIPWPAAHSSAAPPGRSAGGGVTASLCRVGNQSSGPTNSSLISKRTPYGTAPRWAPRFDGSLDASSGLRRRRGLLLARWPFNIARPRSPWCGSSRVSCVRPASGGDGA